MDRRTFTLTFTLEVHLEGATECSAEQLQAHANYDSYDQGRHSPDHEDVMKAAGIALEIAARQALMEAYDKRYGDTMIRHHSAHSNFSYQGRAASTAAAFRLNQIGAYAYGQPHVTITASHAE